MARIGLLGGSFNPAHGGHRHISLQAMRALALDEVWWLVSPGNPQHCFIWLLGSDILPNFHKWRDWRGLAREVPIAVIRRPGYDSVARAARALGWLGRFVHPSSQARHWTEWSAPAILFLRLPPDPTSATAIRAQDPSWYRRSSLLAQKRGRRPATVRQETP
jgi:nicotinate-nucleotide adenylyltransferase